MITFIQPLKPTKFVDLDNLELIRASTLVADHKKLMTVMWYSARSRKSDTLHCKVFINLPNLHLSGHAKVGGGGYDKFSTSFEQALASMGFTLAISIAGKGTFEVEDTMKDLVFSFANLQEVTPSVIITHHH